MSNVGKLEKKYQTEQQLPFLVINYYGTCADIHSICSNCVVYFIFISYAGKHISAKHVYYYSLLAIIC